MLSLGVGSAGTTPELSRPASGPQQPNRDEQRRASLLNVLRSPPSHAMPPLAEPVITHPQRDAPEPTALPPAVVSPPPGSTGNVGAASAAPAPPMPAKSPFDFVSPFDAFDKPAARPPPTPSAPASSVPSAPSTRTTSVKSPAPPASPTKRDAPPAAAAGTPPTQTQAQPRRDSSSAAKKEAAGPSLASTLLKGAEGAGPKALSPGGVTIDMSKPNLDAVVNHPGSFRVTPATIMKAESVGFSRGRSVGAAGGWIAYTLPRGRVRLIDMTSGARTLIQLEATGPIVDLAVTTDAVAVVASDGSVNAYRIPQNWDRDDPECPLIFRLPPIEPGSVPADKSLGDINQLEWVRRDEPKSNWLAIGGTEGAVIIKPTAWGEQAPVANAREMLTAHRVLKTSGLVVQFCLNATDQAIGLISSSGYFCLYSVASLNKVWHRQLPSSNTAAPLSSVRFCEAHIIVGRANDTMFDLVQITYELAVISTIKFNAPASSQPSFGNAFYDSQHETLFVSQFARGSIYAFRYKLKGAQPLRGVTGPDAKSVLAFDAMSEFPAEPIVSFVIGPATTEDPDLLYASPTGISQVHIDKNLLPPNPQGATSQAAAGSVKPTEQEKVEEPQTAAPKGLVERRGKRGANDQRRSMTPQSGSGRGPHTPQESPQRGPGSPLKPRAPSFAASTSSGAADDKAAAAASSARPSIVNGLTTDDLDKALKKTEDKLANQIKQAIQAELGPTSRGNANLPASVTTAVTNHLQSNLPGLVQQELQRAVPGAVQSALRELAPGAIHQSLQNIGRDVERVLAPIVPRTLNTVVQPAVERAVRDAISQAIVPALDNATTRVYDQLAADLKSEMVQIRKDVISEQGDALTATNDMIHNLSSMVESLQRQVTALSARSPAAPAAAPLAAAHLAPRSVIMSPPSASQSTLAAPAPAAPAPSQDTKQLEDAFLSALSTQTAPSTLKLVSDFAPRTDQILPARPGHSPLSQAVLLTLVHRVSSSFCTSFQRHPLTPSSRPRSAPSHRTTLCSRLSRRGSAAPSTSWTPATRALPSTFLASPTS